MSRIGMYAVALTIGITTAGCASLPLADFDPTVPYAEPKAVPTASDSRSDARRGSATAFTVPESRIAFVEVENAQGVPIPVRAYVAKEAEPGATVIVLHHVNGLMMHHEQWAQRLNGWGYHAVVVDSFSPRGSRALRHPLDVTPRQRVPDVRAAADWVRQQEWSDGRIAVLGDSHGAMTVFEVALAQPAIADAGVAYYPYCEGSYRHARIPIMLHLAVKDNWTPIDSCRYFYRTGSDFVTPLLYPDAHHCFDQEPYGQGVRWWRQTARGQRMVTCEGHGQSASLSFERSREFLGVHLPTKQH